MESLIMKRKFVLLFVIILLIGLVGSSGNWGDISSVDDAVDDTAADTSDETNEDNAIPQDQQNYNDNELPSFLQNRKYTYNFYIALGVSTLGILIMFFFLFLFLRNPKNKWNKKKLRRNIQKRKN